MFITSETAPMMQKLVRCAMAPITKAIANAELTTRVGILVAVALIARGFQWR